jgi:hypothetical protein
MYRWSHPEQVPLPSATASSMTGVLAKSGHPPQRTWGALSFKNRRRAMPSKPNPSRAAVRSTTSSRRRPAAEISRPRGRPGPARFEVVAFESLRQETAKLRLIDLALPRRWRKSPCASASVGSDGGGVDGGMRGANESSKTQSPGAGRPSIPFDKRQLSLSWSTAPSKTGGNAPHMMSSMHEALFQYTMHTNRALRTSTISWSIRVRLMGAWVC